MSCRENMYLIADSKFINVRYYQKLPLVHMRCYIEGYSGRMYPTTTGIAVSLQRFKTLCREIKNINESEENTIHIEGNLYVLLTKDTVDIRKFENEKPSQKGLMLNREEWGAFTNIVQHNEQFKKDLEAFAENM